MVLELVRAGVGATVTFASSTPAVLGRGAVALELTGQPPNTFLLVTRSRQSPTPAGRAFAALAIDQFGG